MIGVHFVSEFSGNNILRKFEKHKLNTYYSQPREFLLSLVMKIRTLCVISGKHRGTGWTKDPSAARPMQATYPNLQFRPCCCFNLKSGCPVASGMVIVCGAEGLFKVAVIISKLQIIREEYVKNVFF